MRDNIFKHKRTWIALGALIAAIGSWVVGDLSLFQLIQAHSDTVIMLIIGLIGLFSVTAEVKKNNRE